MLCITEADARRQLAGTSRSTSSLTGSGKFRKLWPKPASIMMSPAAVGTRQPVTLCVSTKSGMDFLQRACRKRNLYCCWDWGRTRCRQDSDPCRHRSPGPTLELLAALRKPVRTPLRRRLKRRPPQSKNLHLTQARQATVTARLWTGLSVLGVTPVLPLKL